MEKRYRKEIFKIQKKHQKLLFSPLETSSPFLGKNFSNLNLNKYSPLIKEYNNQNNQISPFNPFEFFDPDGSSIPLWYKMDYNESRQENICSKSSQNILSREALIKTFEKNGIKILLSKLKIEGCEGMPISIHPKLKIDNYSPECLNFIFEDKIRVKSTYVNEALILENAKAKSTKKPQSPEQIKVKCSEC